ncbi:cytochrome-c oxidase, cbb3-type subunit III [Erythrobacter ani]|uniref:Cbb3-type cytochrome c oxidase subunit n=1 Tax=Erythrobacter ani TaxID=2827235 RepID=A0ABS6SNY6_9SPHN|nr:cytochrome-c oxidase, cbb3-type subunit III [Erythrobacter ani]MBV7266349.1 cytochrome-c oxidase, cbb3-type subunit III [Erythrobacter ani]
MANEIGPGKRIDEPTGTETVGHEWDGIEELNTPLPRWWLWTFYATVIWAVAYTVFYPAWPMIDRATSGVLGWSSRGELAEDMTAADLARQDVFERIAATDIEKIASSPQLQQQAIAGGAAAFQVNCVQCHGAGAAGIAGGYPNLNDDDWLWGGDLEAIEMTLLHGIRWEGSNQTRLSYMPGFDGIFDDAQLDALVQHVLSLSGRAQPSASGAETYTVNCAACHQPSGEGDQIQGAPALNDAIWLYGSDPEQIRQQILYPKHGVMPGWKDRLDPATIRMLATYVHSRGGGEASPQPAEPVEEEAAVALNDQP